MTNKRNTLAIEADLRDKSRPEIIDEHGTRHRHGCDLPPTEILPAGKVKGWNFHRCPTCGAARLVRAGGRAHG